MTTTDPTVSGRLARFFRQPYFQSLRYWRVDVLSCFVIGAVLTPPDPFSIFYVAVPLLVVWTIVRYVIARCVAKRAEPDEAEIVMTFLVPLLPVSSISASVEFYTRLGFTVESRNDEWGFAMLRFNKCVLMVDQSINPSSGALRHSVIYLYPDNIVKYHKLVRANGIAAADLERMPYGQTEFRLDDPDGNHLWVGQPTTVGG